MKNTDLVHAIDELLACDAEQLQTLRAETQAVHSAFDDLMQRLRHEIEAKSAPGATHLRG